VSAKQWLYRFIATVVTLFLSLEIVYQMVPFHRHNVAYLVNEFIPSLHNRSYETVLLGDSLAAATFNRLKLHDHILDLTSNQAVSMAGNYFILERYLENNRAPKRIYLFVIPMFLHNNLHQRWTYNYFETVFTRPSEITQIQAILPDLYAKKYSFDRYIESRKNSLKITSCYRVKPRLPHQSIDEKSLKKDTNFMNQALYDEIATAQSQASTLEPIPTHFLEKIQTLCTRLKIDFTLVLEPMPPKVNEIFKNSKFMHYLKDRDISVININDYYTFDNLYFKHDGFHINKDVNKYYQELLDKHILDIY
jgi:hypothetical protein